MRSSARLPPVKARRPHVRFYLWEKKGARLVLQPTPIARGLMPCAVIAGIEASQLTGRDQAWLRNKAISKMTAKGTGYAAAAIVVCPPRTFLREGKYLDSNRSYFGTFGDSSGGISVEGPTLAIVERELGKLASSVLFIETGKRLSGR